MRRIKCLDIPGMTTQGVLDEFTERRAGEFGIGEKDIISVSSRPAKRSILIRTPEGSRQPRVVVSIFYWGDG